LWFDEIGTHIRYMTLPLGQIFSTYGTENQHFLFSILARISILTFGDTVWAFRLPAVLFGVASIWSLYRMGREVGSEQEALFAAGLFTFSYHHVWFSQNARGYSGLLFWTLLASWLLLRALRDDRGQSWVAYAFAAALGVYTQATMPFVLVGHAIIAGIHMWRRSIVLGPLVGFGLGALLTVQLHALALPQIFGDVRGMHSAVEEWKKPLWALSELVSGLQINFAGGFAAAGAILLFGAGMISFLRSRWEVVALLLIPPALGASLVLSMGHHIWPRFFYFVFGFAALIVIRGATVLGDVGGKRGLTTLSQLLRAKSTTMAQKWTERSVPFFPFFRASLVSGAACCAMVVVSAMSVPFAFGPKQDFGGAREFVESQKQPGDAIVTADLASFIYTSYYKAGYEEVKSAAQLREIRARSKRVYLIYTLEQVLKSQHPDVYALVKQDFTVAKRFGGTLKNGTVVVVVAGQ
jgi:hypothetical protein